METEQTFKPAQPLALARNLGPAYGVTGSRLEHGLSAGVAEQARRKAQAEFGPAVVSSQVEMRGTTA